MPARSFAVLAVPLVLAAYPAASQIVVDGPGVYTSSGDHTAGPNGVQTRLGNSIVAPDGAYNRTGETLVGPNGASARSDGTIFGGDGSTARSVGKTTFIHGPDGSLTCRSMGRHVTCY
jgi:hypothetical protein